jgi:hypothetical protein
MALMCFLGSKQPAVAVLWDAFHVGVLYIVDEGTVQKQSKRQKQRPRKKVGP